MVGKLELVLPELKVQHITAKDFFVIHLGLLSLLMPVQRALHLHNTQWRHKYSAAPPATPFKLGVAAMTTNFRVWCEVEAEKTEADKDEDTKPAAFLASSLVSGKRATCFHCGPMQITKHHYARNQRKRVQSKVLPEVLQCYLEFPT